MSGKFIAIEGLDGAGKSTQVKLLREFLKIKGIRTKFVHFPRSGHGIFGELISRFLRGEFGDVKDVHPQLVALLFAEDRKEFSDTIKKWLKEDYFVIVDRYVLSNIAFQCAKLEKAVEKRSLKKWIYVYEYEHNKIPKPDLSLYIDVPFEFASASLMKKREGDERAYLNGKEDIHEKDLALQNAVQGEYKKLMRDEKNFYQIVSYDSNGKIKTVGDIHNEIIKVVSACLDKNIKAILSKK